MWPALLLVFLFLGGRKTQQVGMRFPDRPVRVPLGQREAFQRKAKKILQSLEWDEKEQAAFEKASHDMHAAAKAGFGWGQIVVVFLQALDQSGGNAEGILKLVQRELGVPDTGEYDAATKEAIARNGLVK